MLLPGQKTRLRLQGTSRLHVGDIGRLLQHQTCSNWFQHVLLASQLSCRKERTGQTNKRSQGKHALPPDHLRWGVLIGASRLCTADDTVLLRMRTDQTRKETEQQALAHEYGWLDEGWESAQQIDCEHNPTAHQRANEKWCLN